MTHIFRSNLAMLLFPAATALVGTTVAGCYARAEPPVVGYADTTSAPVDIETYPSVAYEGQPVYFYGNRWWHRDGARWDYYREEPAELHRQRAAVIHAPRARVRAEVHEEHR